MANPNKSSSPLDLTWHHHETTGKLTLVDRLDHANNHAYITRQEKEVEICGVEVS
ncbi:HNH endonuclease [Vibrio rotiferianus]|uniref:HNH endonuclease n=1 Tax=Vibrio rotiferianus TaxID=190895 RepID=UPI00339A2EDF